MATDDPQSEAPAEPGQSEPQTPTPATSDNGGETETPQSQYLTAKQAAEMFVGKGDVGKEVATAFQTLQSQQAKFQADMSKQIDERLKIAKASGWQPTPDQERTFLEATRQGLQEQLPPGNQDPQTQTPPTNSPIADLAEGIMKREGVEIKPADPSYALIDQKTHDSKMFLESVYKAIEDHKQRLKNPASTPASVPTVTGSGGPSPTLTQEYQKKLKEIPRGSLKAVADLQYEYRKKGIELSS